jgi:2-succinyl-6-hydroxy-2,4-cyclohexadiene-1-carboxylate synthase
MLPGLVLVHGFTQTGASWEPVAGRVRERYRPLAVDLPTGPSWDAVTGWVAQRVRDHRATTLCGYSMGGRIALAAALDLGGELDHLVLIGASPGISDPAERAARRAADKAQAAEIEREGVEAFADRWGAQRLFATQSPAVAAAARADRLRHGTGDLAATLHTLGTGVMPSLWDALPRLETPTTLVAGALDPRFVALAEAMADRLPRAEVVVVPSAGHAVQLEDPQAIAALL